MPWTPPSPGLPIAFWFEAGPSTCFTDSAGTVPCSADGDLVQVIRDKGTGAIILQQTTAANRPTYHPNGGFPYIQFPGTSTAYMAWNVTGSALCDASGQHSGGAIMEFDSNVAGGGVIGYSTGTTLGTPIINNNGTVQSFSKSAPTRITDSGPTVPLNTPVVLSEITQTASIEAFVNGATNGASNLGSSTLPYNTNTGLQIGFSVHGKYFGFVMYKGVLIPADHTSLRAYLMALAVSAAVPRGYAQLIG